MSSDLTADEATPTFTESSDFIVELSNQTYSLVSTGVTAELSNQTSSPVVCNQTRHYEKYECATHSSYPLKLKYLLPFYVNYVQLVTQQYE